MNAAPAGTTDDGAEVKTPLVTKLWMAAVTFLAAVLGTVLLQGYRRVARRLRAC